MITKQHSIVTLQKLPVGTLQPTLFALLHFLNADAPNEITVSAEITLELTEEQQKKVGQFLNYGFLLGSLKSGS